MECVLHAVLHTNAESGRERARERERERERRARAHKQCAVSCMIILQYVKGVLASRLLKRCPNPYYSIISFKMLQQIF